MERQEASFKWYSVSHASCLCLLSVLWRNGILRALAGQVGTGPAEAQGSPCGSLSAQSPEIALPVCSLVGGERIPNPQGGHQLWSSQGEVFRGVGKGILSMCGGGGVSGMG